MNQKVSHWLKILGPGIMFAGACIGGSHLVQSTKAGAYYGFSFLSIVIISNIFKYPFFEFASRYTNATGESVLEGYKRQSKFIIPLFAVITFSTMFIMSASIGFFCGGLFHNLVNSFVKVDLGRSANWSLVTLIVVFGLLCYGKFGIIDKALKAIGVVLVLTLLTAFFSVLFLEPWPKSSPSTLEVLGSKSGFLFAIALMGWMPMGVDMSAWHSMWTQERIKQSGYYPTLKETLTEFNIGYFITVIMAVLFLFIGAFILFNNPLYSKENIASMSGLAYSHTLVNMFVLSIGNWSKPVIEVAAFCVIFSSSIALTDGYARTMMRLVNLWKGERTEFSKNKRAFLMWLVVITAGSYFIIYFFIHNLGSIINIATTISFLVAPLAAYLNYKIVFLNNIPESHRPPKWLKQLAIAGITFLVTFATIYLFILFTN